MFLISVVLRSFSFLECTNLQLNNIFSIHVLKEKINIKTYLGQIFKNVKFFYIINYYYSKEPILEF